jgi:hypothetical protein
MLQILVPKRMRSEDYYLKLYDDYSKKFYKGEYEDDYDEIADHDKRPLFYEEESSSESENEQKERLVSNQHYLDHVKELHHQRLAVNREEVRQNNANKPKFGRVQNNEPKKYAPKGMEDPAKKKFAAKEVSTEEREEPARKKYVEKQEVIRE